MNALVLVTLVGFLLVFVLTDICHRKIPNVIVASGTVLGAVIAVQLDGLGFWNVVSGWAIAMGLLMPIYLLRGMSAGDVKLMGMVGAFLGMQGALLATLYACVSGGALAVAWWVLCRWHVVQGGGICVAQAVQTQNPEGSSAGGVDASRKRVPYAVAIAAGTGIYLLTLDSNFLFAM